MTVRSVKIYNGNIVENKYLYHSIKKLLQPDYQDFTSVLERETKRCKNVYFLEVKGIVVGFFMTNWESISGKHAVYLGLNAVHEKFKNKGLTTLLYLRFIEDGILFEKQEKTKLILCATTASPAVVNAVLKLSRNCSPNKNGEFNNYHKNLAISYAIKHDLKYSKNHPFILKNAATKTLYSAKENERIEKLVNKHSFSLFEKLGIKEKKGDRLLMICELPKKESYLKIKNTCEYVMKKKLAKTLW
ncbi:GNAT family N-acetyltransferase [Ascidiimonas sp. W6]|uniref:GNAT family N-acetyltransferase n=1 Tax=Ascidiimonas meishanensis TaxID=3128903 RepID=UPI0030EBD728